METNFNLLPERARITSFVHVCFYGDWCYGLEPLLVKAHTFKQRMQFGNVYSDHSLVSCNSLACIFSKCTMIT